MSSIKWAMNEKKRSVAPRDVPSWEILSRIFPHVLAHIGKFFCMNDCWQKVVFNYLFFLSEKKTAINVWQRCWSMKPVCWCLSVVKASSYVSIFKSFYILFLLKSIRYCSLLQSENTNKNLESDNTVLISKINDVASIPNTIRYKQYFVEHAFYAKEAWKRNKRETYSNNICTN